ncbi:MAG: hypothetical protein ACI9OJ_003438, partial [Myxococcota bacterium]
MSRLAIATLVLLPMTLFVPDSHAEAPTLESLALYPMVSGRVPDSDTARLLELAQNIIDAFDDRSLFSAVGGFYQPEPVGQLIAGAAAVKKAIEKAAADTSGANSAATNPAVVQLAGLYYRLNLVAETYYVVVALDDLGTPLAAGMPEEQKATAKAYTATMRALPELNQRVPGLVKPYLKEQPKDADALRLMARHHAGNFEFKEANTYYDRLVAVSRTADDHFEAARYAGYLQTERESDAALSALVKRFPNAAWRRFATKRRQTLGRELVDTQQKLAADENETTTLNVVETVLRYLGGSSARSYRTIANAEKKYPSSGDARIARGVWLLGGASVQGATAVMEELDTTGMPVTRNTLIGSRMTLRFSQLYSLVTQGRIGEVAPLLDTIEKDRI